MGKILILVVAAVVVILLVLGVSAIGSYNSLVGKREEVTAKWSAVETQLQRRSDLIGNLVGAVQGSFTQEQVVFGDIANARAGLVNAMRGGSRADVIAADNQLGAALDRINFVNIVENYPQLQSNSNVQNLMTQLEGTENRVAVSRQDYNNAVRDYNVSRRTFPTSLLAGLLGFGEETAYFEAAPASREAPKVEFKDPRSAPAPAPAR
jgi:LemA protein